RAQGGADLPGAGEPSAPGTSGARGGPGDHGGPDGRDGGPGHGPDGWFGLPPEFGRHVSAWLPIAASILASLLFAALLAWYFARPIRALRTAFEAAAAGDLAPKFGDGKSAVGGDELAE